MDSLLKELAGYDNAPGLEGQAASPPELFMNRHREDVMSLVHVNEMWPISKWRTIRLIDSNAAPHA